MLLNGNNRVWRKREGEGEREEERERGRGEEKEKNEGRQKVEEKNISKVYMYMHSYMYLQCVSWFNERDFCQLILSYCKSISAILSKPTSKIK